MPVALGPDQDRARDLGLLRAVEIAHEGLDAALVEQLLALLLGVAQVGQHDAHARVEEGELAQPVLERAVVELDDALEGLGRGQEA